MTTESSGLAGSGEGRAVGIDAETVPQPAVGVSGFDLRVQLRCTTVAVAEVVGRTTRDW
jgi:hypothetical protein